MKIALTGSSSTGKTTLAVELMKDSTLVARLGEHLEERARELLRAMGHTSMDRMSRAETRAFQLAYIEAKEQREAQLTRFLVDRSFVDAVAYWIERDDPSDELGLHGVLLDRCRRGALAYDGHIYCPFGVIPFVADGYRSDSSNFHERVDRRIRSLLNEWGVRYLTVNSSGLNERCRVVRDWIEHL